MMSLEQIHATRAEQRKQRLIEAERELAAEEAEALHMTEEQRRILMQPFAQVKAEFTDLDGLRWTQAALRKLQPPQRRASNHATATSHGHGHGHATSKLNTFVVLTNADLANFSAEDTIRISSSSTQSRPSLPSPSPSPPSQNKHPLPTPDPALRHRDGSRSRSPIKGLFPSRPPETGVDNPGETPIKPPTSLRFSVPPISGTADPLNPSTSPSFSRHPTSGFQSPSHIQTPAPPGLAPDPPSYHSPVVMMTTPPDLSTSYVTPPTPHHRRDLTVSPAKPHLGRGLKRQKTMDSLSELFQQGTPSPTSPSLPAAPPPAATLSLLSPPSPSMPSASSSCALTPVNHVGRHPVVNGGPPKSARARLHSILNDDPRVSSPSTTGPHSQSPAPSTSPPPPSFPSHTFVTTPSISQHTTTHKPLDNIPTVPVHPTSVPLRLPAIDTSHDVHYDDDETPTPSPVLENLDYGDDHSSAPWIRP